eukprot:Seg1311.3 transcript_id=Seg1311.3/GoldUCD/mRNA.D3Y31 product="hypothetical protein" protein_id=Seg1311.3/GoldUCD/D3Y31
MVIKLFSFILRVSIQTLFISVSAGAMNYTDQVTDVPYEFASSFSAVAGRGFSRSYPKHIFQDSDWGHTERYQVSLRTKDNNQLFSNSWISLDHTRQKIIGFPMHGNQGEFIFLLCARNSRGQIKRRKIRVDVLVDKFMSMHQVVMKVTRGFRNFMIDLNHRILFASTIADFLREKGIKTEMRDIWITEIKSNDYSISWVLSTYNRNSCSEVLTKQLPKILSSRGKPNSELLRKLYPHFALNFISTEISDSCPRLSHIAKQVGNTDLIVGPILIIIIMIGLSSPIFFAYIIRRGIRKREFRRARDVRHVFTNGAATPIHMDHDDINDAVRSQDDLGHRVQYRWSPDITNRVPVQIPRFPLPRARPSPNESRQGSVDSGKSTAWHGLPSEQCIENDGLQFVNVFQSISQSASTLRSYLLPVVEKEIEIQAKERHFKEEDSFSIKSEGTKILDSALKKVTSFINMSNLSATTLIRISKSDVNDDSNLTRKSSLETRNSSFECSLLSGDFPTPSQLSSGVNSFDTENLMSTASFSQDESFNDETAFMPNITEDNAGCMVRWEEEENSKMITDTRRPDFAQTKIFRKSTMSIKSSFSEKEDDSFDKEADSTAVSTPMRKTSLRGSLKRMPHLQVSDCEQLDDTKLNAKSDLLHPWYRDQETVHIQQTGKGTISQYYISKGPKVDKTRTILQRDIIYESCYDEGAGHPTMV